MAEARSESSHKAQPTYHVTRGEGVVTLTATGALPNPGINAVKKALRKAREKANAQVAIGHQPANNSHPHLFTLTAVEETREGAMEMIEDILTKKFVRAKSKAPKTKLPEAQAKPNRFKLQPHILGNFSVRVLVNADGAVGKKEFRHIGKLFEAAAKKFGGKPDREQLYDHQESVDPRKDYEVVSTRMTFHFSLAPEVPKDAHKNILNKLQSDLNSSKRLALKK